MRVEIAGALSTGKSTLAQMLVHLVCEPEEQIARIRKRGRDFEQGARRRLR